MASPAGRVAPLLFASGMCALVYQIAWLREFRLVFGASTAASAAVIAIFIGGLGTGGLLIGPRADRHPSPLGLYARLEALIALTAALTPGLLWLVREGYVAAGGTLVLGLGTGTLVRLLLAALVLALPTCLMGGTLPAAARAVATRDDQGRRSVALLYGVNTLGAVAGAFCATFFMLEVFGTRRTLWLACLVNILVAMFARQMARSLAPEAPGEVATSPQPGAPAPAWFVLGASGLVGFAFFLMELVWYRMLAPILGGSIYTFGLILAVALLGIGLGGAAYSLLRSNRPASLSGFAYTCLLEAALIGLPFALGDRVALLAALLRPLGSVGLFWGHVLGWTVVCFLVVLPAAIVAGYQFPMLIALLGRGRERVGRQVGLAYAWNTVGAILGSLAGGFGLIPLLSAPGAWRATGILLLALGLMTVVMSLRHDPGPPRLVVPAALSVAVIVSLGAVGPSAAWRHSGIGVGRAPSSFASPNALETWLRHHRSIVQWEADGVESSVALEALGPGYAFVINGKIDGNARGDAATMIMSGLLGAALHPDPRRSLVIGLGTGGTAGWLAAIPSMERTDVVELEPLILRVAEDCAPVNHAVMTNPKVRITVGDAREALLVSRDTYDIIFSEPSNPYRAGIASLFTREYYEAVERRLGQDGLFLQWVQSYEIDGQTLRTIYATLVSVFPEVETWQVNNADLILVASRHPVRYDVPALRARLAQEPFRSGLRVSWDVDDLEGFLAYFVARSGMARAIAAREGGRLNTDDQNLVEFGFARTVGMFGLLSIEQLRETAWLRGDDRPLVVGGEVDWERLDDMRVPLYRVPGQAQMIRDRFSPEQRLLAQVFERFVAGDSAGALAGWRALRREPRTPLERTVAAVVLAEAGDPAALPYVAQLGAVHPVEADSLRALLSARQGRTEDAVAALEATFVGYRTNPWPRSSLVGAALELAVEIAHSKPQVAARLFETLRTPFVMRSLEEARLNTLAELASRMDLRTACAEVIKPLEPHIPWDRSWLTLRQRCYAATGDPAAGRAAADLARFMRHEPEVFHRGLRPVIPTGDGS